MIPTPHLEMNDKDLVAKTVLMPGDPLRAKFIADNYLEDCKVINTVRGMLGYTGLYKGRKISVIASGMGMPSIGIYSYELFTFYDVDCIVRIGSCGAYTDDLDLYDCLLATKAWSESTYAKTMGLADVDCIDASLELNDSIKAIALEKNIPLKECVIHSSDVFYRIGGTDFEEIYKTYGCKAVEMECFALFANALACNKKAACLLTVSDSFVKSETTTSLERQTTFTKMMEIALELAN